MRSCTRFILALCLLGLLLGDRPCLANFHLMQIEQVIGGVEGDTSAQAIQLRMRAAGQQLVAQGRIRVWDAAGANPITVIDMTTNVTNSPTGARVLVCTSSFLAKTSPSTVADFIMTTPIPASYLAAGRMTFEADNGSILWSLSWGGSLYTGPNTGTTVNDMDGNFGPPFPGALPSTSLQAVKFGGLPTAASSNNAADYALTAGAAVFTNNAAASFTLVSNCTPPSISEQPDPGHDRVGFDFSFSVSATGTDPLTYRWRKDEVDLVDDARIMGSGTAALTIYPVEQGDSGSYDVVVSNACGSRTSDPATLAIFCPADYDFNGFVNGDDFDAFVWAFEQGDMAADFDENTFVNGDDFDGFSLAFLWGC